MGNKIPSLGNLHGYAAKDAVGMAWKTAFLRSRRLSEYQRYTANRAGTRFVVAGGVAYNVYPFIVTDYALLSVAGLLISWDLIDGGVKRLRYGHQEAARLIDAYGEIEKDAATMYARDDITAEEARDLIARFRRVDFGDYKDVYSWFYFSHETDESDFSKLIEYRYDAK